MEALKDSFPTCYIIS